MHAKAARELDVGLADDERLVDLPEIGVPREPLEDGSRGAPASIERTVQGAVDQHVAQRDGVSELPVMVKMDDTLIGLGRRALRERPRQRAIPGLTCKLRHRDRRRVRFEIREVEREREPSTVERMGNDRAAPSVAIAGDEAFVGQEVEGVAHRHSPDTELFHQRVERWQTIAGLPFARRDAASENRCDAPIGGDAQAPASLRRRPGARRGTRERDSVHGFGWAFSGSRATWGVRHTGRIEQDPI